MPLDTPPALVWHSQIGDDDPLHQPALYPCRLLAEGDSWFSMNAVPGICLLNRLRLARDAVIVNCAMPGDTIRNMVKMRNDPAFQLEAEGGIRWDAILLSGGGNDVIDDAKWIIPARSEAPAADLPASAYCDEIQLQRTLDGVVDGYRKLFLLRDSPRSTCRTAPILIHTYDRITPRDSAARFFKGVKLRGPWFHTALVAAKVPTRRWNEVADFIFGALANRLLALGDPVRGIHVVDTRGTLKRARAGTTKSSADWQNEIHPNAGGYDKLSAVLSPVLAELLG